MTRPGTSRSASKPLTPGDAVVLDTSAVLVWLRDEPGAAVVDPLLPAGVMSTPNWSELWQKLEQHGADAARTTRRLQTLGIEVEPLSVIDAVSAALLWPDGRGRGLSLADRCCLALARRIGRPAVTADKAWASLDIDDLTVQLIR